MGVLVTRGIILRYANYRETSRILTLFSCDLGKITVSAKGCLRPKSRERAAAEMFTLGEYTLTERAGRYYLNAASIENAYYNLRLDIDRLALASYFTELCDSVLNEEEPQPELFELLASMLSALCDEKADPELVRLFFEVKAMDVLGFRPEVSSCSSCGGELKEKLWFSVSAGGAVCENCRLEATDARLILPGSVAFLRHVQDWEIERMNVLKPAGAVMENLEQLWRPFLKWHLERTYKIDGFMDKLKGMSGL
jgi:DNA repair protein RecO (recombination protein O)